MVLKGSNQASKRLDWFKWSVVAIILLAGMIGNHYYSNVSVPLRVITWFGLLAVASFIASKTNRGQWTLELFLEARKELRKVVWPTREETVQTTLVVAIMVIILALMLWGLDGILVWLIGWLTGQRG